MPVSKKTLKLGTYFDEFTFDYEGSWLSQKLKIFENGILEIEWKVGPIPIEDLVGKVDITPKSIKC